MKKPTTFHGTTKNSKLLKNTTTRYTRRRKDRRQGGTGFVFRNWNKPVDEEFFTLAKSIPRYDDLFVNDPPEHQWEGRYRLKEGDVFVEAGAFWGRYGLIASKRVKENGKVILIEPHPFNACMIKKAIEKYGLSNVTLVEGAVWSSNQTISFCIAGNPASARKAEDSDYKNYPGEIIKVKAYALDSLLSELSIDHVDLLAGDVEGAEVEMVKGAETFFTEHRIRNVAIAAYHHQELGLSEQVIAFLKSKGYKDIFYSKDLPHYGGIVYGHI